LHVLAAGVLPTSRDAQAIAELRWPFGSMRQVEGKMAKLILKFDDRVLKECVVGTQPVVIGRISNNHMVIDNPAVSSHHARVFHDGEMVVLEDLESTNGTFVNGRRVDRAVLVHGDRLRIGRLELLVSFDELSAPAT
jgi:pSer/pThr/pTyr-binding forkhead associated (FHA) protein